MQEEREGSEKKEDMEHYRRICQQLVVDEELLHQENLKKIKIGIQCLFWIPLIFLAMIFLTDGEKVIFLVLWIASLFVIASYLIYTEYTDFQAQEKLRHYKDEDGLNENLIGTDIEAFEETVEELLNMIDRKKAENKEKMLQALRLQKPVDENENKKGAGSE